MEHVQDASLTHVPSSQTCTFFQPVHSTPVRLHHLPASYKHGVSRVYARPRPLCPAGGNTRDDITAASAHWFWDVAHLPNRLPVKWRQPRQLPFTFSGVGGAERLPTSEAAPWLAVSRESERLLLREKGEGERFAAGNDASAAPHNLSAKMHPCPPFPSVSLLSLILPELWFIKECTFQQSNSLDTESQSSKKPQCEAFNPAAPTFFLYKQRSWCISTVCSGMALLLSITYSFSRRGGGMCALLLVLGSLLPPLGPPSCCSYGSRSSDWIL